MIKHIKSAISVIRKRRWLSISIILVVLVAIVASIVFSAAYRNRNSSSLSKQIGKIEGGIRVEKQANSSNLQYEVSKKEIIIFGFKDEVPEFTSLNIPDTIEGLPVTTIAPEAFQNNIFLETVVLGNNIKSIEDKAFNNCAKLQLVFFGKSTEKIGREAFKGCVKLTAVSLNNGIKTLEKGSFYNTPIKSIYLPSSVKLIDDSFPVTVTLSGNSGTYAENWAIQNEFKFIKTN